MEKLSVRLASGIIAASMSVVCAVPTVAASKPGSELQEVLVALKKAYPDLSRVQLNEAIRSWKASDGSSYDAAIFLLGAKSPKHPLVVKAKSKLRSSGKKNQGTVQVPVGRGAGDLFAHTATGAGPIRTGHVGMWSTKQQVVHATGFPLKNGKKEGVVVQDRKIVKLYRGASSLMWVNTSNSRRSSAVNFAKSKAKAKAGYNDNYVRNKVINAKSYNCSQLVWAAYKRLGIDLDGGGIHGHSWVSPSDIIGARETSVYQRL